MSPLDSPLHQQKKAFWKPSFLHVQCCYCCLKLALLPQSRVEVIFFVKLGEVTMAMVLKNAQRKKKVIKTIKWLFSRIFFSLLFFCNVDTPTYKAGKLSMSVQGQIKLWSKSFYLTFKTMIESYSSYIQM